MCIGWIPGPDFGALGMLSSHWKVVKGVMQPRTWENGPFWGVCDLEHTEKGKFSQSKQMELTIYIKGIQTWQAMGRTILIWVLKGENLFWGLNDPFWG